MTNPTETVTATTGLSPVDGESDRAFEAFCAYSELGPRRRFAVAARKTGVPLRTVNRWATDFDWRGRIRSHAAGVMAQSASDQSNLHRADLLDAAARARAFRDRQCTLAETFLNVAERYLERMDEDNLDQLRFADACKALALASQLGKVACENADASAVPDQSLRDQLVALLDQAYAETPAPAPPVNPTKP